ncbi:hypothetical protein Tco_0881896, partial [Tanacetum coccineum]
MEISKKNLHQQEINLVLLLLMFLKLQNNLLPKGIRKELRARRQSNQDKAYDRFQKLISQLEVYAVPVSKEDINQKVYKDEMKRSSSSTSNSQNLAFLSSDNTSNTNEVSTTSGNFGVNAAGGTSSTSQGSSTPGVDEVIDQDDLEELDIRWQVAMMTVRVQRFIQKTKRNLDFKGIQLVTFDKRNATTNEPSSQALVAQDILGGYDWSNDFDEPINYALMDISSSSSSSSSDNEIQNCSKQ